MNMRAKFKIEHITKFEYGEELFMTPVTNGSPEDNTYSKYTPSGSLKIMITNPSLIGQYKPGQKLYMDFTNAE